MNCFRRLRRGLALLLAVVMLAISMPLGSARAAVVTTDQVLAESGASDRERVLAFLDRVDVRQQIAALGVDPAEAAARVAALSDAQVREIAGQLDQLPAGQSAVGVVVGAILIIFLVLLVTDLLGLTDVFPFVNHR